MLLSVQQAARRFGVSPVTIRRWTATGFLPCTRTAGGHRRIDDHDIDDLAKAIGNSNHLAAQLAREREVDVLINTSIALAGKIDLTELLVEIAMRMTSLLDCHFCAISEYDTEAQSLVTLAEYDHAGRRLPDGSPYDLRDFPLTRTVLQDQTAAVVNSDDPDADPAEVAELRREGDRSLLMVPLIVQGDTIGILEVVDQKRSRAYSRQELRLAGAIAGQAAVAIKNAKLFAERCRSDEDVSSLRRVLVDLTTRAPAVSAAGRGPDLLTAVAGAVCEAFGAISCVASVGGASAGAFGAGRVAARPASGNAERGANASLVVSRDPSGRTDLTLAVTLGEPPGEGQVELLDFIVAITAGVMAPAGPAA
ncbi:MAG: GAF domain-containing protein [Actinobacteria bacterium]|nr:GAF domain-containing protein [Actinomycetota bacterium]